ncbi:hypothetical protein ACH5RR_001691 [Cinchona calisaya]|uniref:Uncharacterized protein n=1 Tax=Cinchona calisaya TaxID=153742 RepID=A0ABD3B4N7_9GENT
MSKGYGVRSLGDGKRKGVMFGLGFEVENSGEGFMGGGKEKRGERIADVGVVEEERVCETVKSEVWKWKTVLWGPA